MEIVTGNTGRVHVTPIDDAVRNSHLMLINKKAVFTVPNYRSFEAEIRTANEVRVYSGYASNQGRIFKIDENDFDSVTIESGSDGVKRMDLIVARYTMNQQTGFESINIAVIRGESGTEYTRPEHTTGNINSGALVDDFPLYEVYINGTIIDHLTACFEILPDGGELGLALQRMDEIEGDIERIPFDLGDVVNKTYVDNQIDNVTSTVIALGLKNFVIPSEVNGVEYGNTPLVLNSGAYGGNTYVLNGGDTGTLESDVEQLLTYAYFDNSGDYRLYLTHSTEEYSGASQVAMWMTSAEIVIKDELNHVVGSVNFSTSGGEEVTFNVPYGDSTYKIFLHIPHGVNISSDDYFEYGINVCNALYDGSKNVAPEIPTRKVTDFISNSLKSVKLNGLSSVLANINDSGVYTVAVDADNNVVRGVNSRGDVSEFPISNEEFKALDSAYNLKIAINGGEVIELESNTARFIARFVDVNGNMAQRAVAIQSVSGNYNFIFYALKKIDNAFSGATTISDVTALTPYKI